MSPWQLESIQDGPRNLPSRFGQNPVSNIWDIADFVTFSVGWVMWLGWVVWEVKSKAISALTVSAIPEHVQIYHFLSKIHWFLSKLYRKLSKFKWHFWEFWQFIPPQNSISGLWEWMRKNFFIPFIISWVIFLKKTYFFKIWTGIRPDSTCSLLEVCKFGQKPW